ncbi:MAG: hypothetical protein JJT76_14855 [Clostridiaceae bacterium]|nr:hypothetical protein [Clostridiaceae bacterium]
MLFIRMAPRLLFLRTSKIEEVTDFLTNNLQGKITDFFRGMDEATEDSSLIFITDSYSIKTDIEDAKAIVLINEPASVCLSALINNKIAHLIEKVDMGPSSMVMRIAGEEDKVMEELKNMYDGRDLPLEEAIKEGEKEDTILFLTHKQLSKRLSKEDLMHTQLLLPHPASMIYKKLRSEGILFITRSLEDRKWYEVRINIYDTQGKYQEHYDRLNHVLTQLEMGMVLEEGWTKDHALTLFSVLAYQVRLFTLYKPEEIKKILLGLEYDDKGERWADFDLYYRNKKISWVDIDKGRKKSNKAVEGLNHRRQLVEKLSDNALRQLKCLEERLIVEY